jgi:hypothetical protein
MMKTTLPVVGGWMGRGMVGSGLAGMILVSGLAVQARDFRVNQIPNGQAFRCANCHVSAGGGGPRNPFGQAVQAITGTSSRTFWSATLAAADSDGDGFSNGQELGDVDGDGSAVPGHAVSNPGNANSRPQNSAPQVSLLEPEGDITVVAPAVFALVAEATDTDGTIAQVEFFRGETLLGVRTEAPYSLLVDWALGVNTVTARATDNQGASATSAPVTVTVTAPEAPTLGMPVRGEGTLGLSWEAGGGPFVVEGKADGAGLWNSVSGVTTQRVATVALAGTSAWLRVVDFAVVEQLALTVSLSGAAERPNPVETPGVGSGSLVLNGHTLSVDVSYEALSSVAVAAHIHGSAGVDEVAGVLVNLAPLHDGPLGTSGRFLGSVVLTGDQKAAVLGGLTYVNIHTGPHPSGEIRGQVVLAPPVGSVGMD